MVFKSAQSVSNVCRAALFAFCIMQGKVFAKGGNLNSNGNENENENRESARFATSLTHCKKKEAGGIFTMPILSGTHKKVKPLNHK